VIFSILNLETGDLSNFELRDHDKSINDYSYVITESKIKIFGLFGDLTKDQTGNSTHGIFYTEIESKSLDYDGLKYTYFDKKMLSTLFAKDPEDKKKTIAISKKKRAKNAENDAAAMDVRFGIEDLFSIDDNNVVLFCSKMYNYSVTTCTSNPNGGSQCTTRYYCQKSNVTSIRINSQGEIVWASNIDRIYTFSGTNIYDVQVIFKNNKFYTIYASIYKVDADKKSRKNQKKYKDQIDSFEYAVFDYENGESKKNTFTVNTKEVAAEDRKMVTPTSIIVIDDLFYVNYMKTSIKWGKSIPLIAASCLCPYLMIIPFTNGNYRKGSGNLGVIAPIDEGGTKSKAKKPVKKK